MNRRAKIDGEWNHITIFCMVAIVAETGGKLLVARTYQTSHLYDNNIAVSQ